MSDYCPSCGRCQSCGAREGAGQTVYKLNNTAAAAAAPPTIEYIDFPAAAAAQTQISGGCEHVRID